MGAVGPWHYQILALMLFALGAIGFLVRRNVIVMALCIELMLNAANLLLITFARVYGHNATGLGNHHVEAQAMALMLMAIAAAEVGVGLALVIMIFRNVPRADVDELHALRG